MNQPSGNNIDAAAGAMSEVFATRLGGHGRAIHPDTVIAAAARMAGTMLLRSFNFGPFGAPPGSVVLSDRANEEGPVLLNVFGECLVGWGLRPNPAALSDFDNRGQPPMLSVLQTQELLDDDLRRIREQFNLSLKDAAVVCALATAWLVKECAPRIGLEVGYRIAAYGFVEGTKTVPRDETPTAPA